MNYFWVFFASVYHIHVLDYFGIVRQIVEIYEENQLLLICMHYKFLIQTKQDNLSGNFVEMSNLFVCDFFF